MIISRYSSLFKLCYGLIVLTSSVQGYQGAFHQQPRLDESRLSVGRRGWFVASAGCIVTALAPSGAKADEYGREVEAPTLFTGETVEICAKRGPLGACVQTEVRTVENDNDKAQKYFKSSTPTQKQQLAQQRSEESGNELIEKLRQQSIDNKEKNDLIVARKTFENNEAATFGPFDRQVLIMNTDGRTFTLLENPQAMRLKKAGFINERRQFITQPTPQQIEDALEAPSQLPGFIKNILGSS